MTSFSAAKQPIIRVLTLIGSAALAMQGIAVADVSGVTIDNFKTPENISWSVQHMRELQPTREVYRGAGPIAPLAAAPVDLADRNYEISGNRTISLEQWFDESATDAFLVLHDGKIVHETYRNGQQQHTQHQMWSVTKSFVGVMTLMLIEEGAISRDNTLASYIPELRQSAFGDATIGQVLNMTADIDYSEDYDDPESSHQQYRKLFLHDCPATGPQSLTALVAGLQKTNTRPHGKAFRYVTPSTDALAWVLRRVTGRSIAELLETRLLQPLGIERDAYLWLDCSGIERAGGGLNITARDAARFGQMILQKGYFNGRQIVPVTVAEQVMAPGDPDIFTAYYDDPWYSEVGHSYHDQWWTFNNPHKAVSAIGIHGQFIYIDPVARMVIVKQSSHLSAENDANELDGPIIWQSIAERLLAGDTGPAE